MPRLVTTAPLRYATRNLRAGEAFDASEADARVLLALGRAADPPAPVLAEPKAADADGPEPPRPSRYRRRDMRAET